MPAHRASVAEVCALHNLESTKRSQCTARRRCTWWQGQFTRYLTSPPPSHTLFLSPPLFLPLSASALSRSTPTPPLLHPYSTYSTPTPPLLHLLHPYSTLTPPLLQARLVGDSG